MDVVKVLLPVVVEPEVPPFRVQAALTDTSISSTMLVLPSAEVIGMERMRPENSVMVVRVRGMARYLLFMLFPYGVRMHLSGKPTLR